MNFFIIFALVSILSTSVLIINLVLSNSESIEKLVEGKRLSTVLSITPSLLELDPRDFEPKKEMVKKKLLQELYSQNHPQPATRAFCIIEHSGLDVFLENSTSTKLRGALARLLVNEDMETAEKLLRTVVDLL